MKQVDYMEQFSGALNLGNELGTFYKQHTQTGAITMAAAAAPCRGGSAQIIIVADGSAINVPAEWVNVGTDAISTVASDENHLFVMYRDNDIVYYSNKIVTP